MRRALLIAIVAALGCVAPQIRKDCSPSCGKGQSCDARYGMCRDDPCSGTCGPGERCRAGSPPHCFRLNMGEVDQNGSGAVPPNADPAHL